MGTIECTVNGPEGTLAFTSISGANPRNTWAKFNGIAFGISEGGSFPFELTVPYSSFRFDPSNPIAWGSIGQPGWIRNVVATAESLTFQADPGTAGTSQFTIRNATPGGAPVGMILQSTAGGGGAGGTVEAYLGNDQRALIGPLPDGAVASGRDVTYGFRDPGISTIVLSPAAGTEILGLTWAPAQPPYIDTLLTGNQIAITVDNLTTLRQTATFTIQTNFGPIDPTIITNPDEGAP